MTRRDARQGPGRPTAAVLLALLAGGAVLGGCTDPIGVVDRAPRVWASLAVGENHACAVDQFGNVFCWGSNDRAQLSAPAGSGTAVPTLSQIGVGAVQVVAGSGYACSLAASGDATCWGEGRVGQLGNGLQFISPIGGRVLGGPWAALSAGAHHACGLLGSEVSCWGGDRYGASLGHRLPVQSRCSTPTTAEFWWCSLEPTPLDSPRPFAAISAGLWHTCGVDGSGAVYCWGQNVLGQLAAPTAHQCLIVDPVHGDSHFPCNFDPVRVDLPEAATAVHAGASHTCAITVTGAAYCWGGTALYAGQLGHGGGDGSSVPVRVASEASFASLSLSRQYIWTASCGLDTGGRALCWGSNRSGEMGAPVADECVTGGGIPCALTPVAVETGERFAEVDVGEGFVCGRTPDGRILCWGLNDLGQLGDGTTQSRQEPREILPIA